MSDFFRDKRTVTGLEKIFKNLMKPIQWLTKDTLHSGILLILLTIVALFIANSSFNETYQHLLHTHLKLTLNDFVLDLSLHHWVNDGLMAIFFYLVGLEIKKEILFGALSSVKKALLPIVSALGGMIVPALIFTIFNFGTEKISGWGIPMATDIAFALAVLLLLGNRIPSALMTILLALAIVDDLGAVLVIAIFYTAELNFQALFGALGCFAFLLLLNKGGVRSLWIYIIIAIIMWLFMLHSGVHATIAGVLGAFATPAKALFTPAQFTEENEKWLKHLEALRRAEPNGNFENSDDLSHSLDDLGRGLFKAEPPARVLMHVLHAPVYFVIIPLFVLCNAGVTFDFSQFGELLQSSVALGVALGLLLGKFIGVFGAIWLSVHYKWATLPEGVSFKHIGGMAILAGIGFTMSIFVAELAYASSPQFLTEAKIAILSASVLAGILGYVYLYLVGSKK